MAGRPEGLSVWHGSDVSHRLPQLEEVDSDTRLQQLVETPSPPRVMPMTWLKSPGAPRESGIAEGNSNPAFPLCMKIFRGWLLFSHSAVTHAVAAFRRLNTTTKGEALPVLASSHAFRRNRNWRLPKSLSCRPQVTRTNWTARVL